MHHYRFTVLALNQPDRLPEGVAGARALSAVGAAADARGSLIATYRR
jgi:phosphatidylethanolamine-binding protein (PEBP) family uncharacterized protein